MFSKIITIILLLLAVLTIYWMINNNDPVSMVENNGVAVKLYKSPSCSCCGVWGSYMQDRGYQVETILEEEMNQVKNNLGIPYELESCHTSEIDGYVVEGHIPDEAIEKLLEERPDIKGIGMAGMPSGSPGMPGPKSDFLIYEINHEGQIGELFMAL